MRIVTWNCQGGFHKKIDELLSQDPDVAIIQECTEKSFTLLLERGYQTLWFGSNPLKKGLGVAYREAWSVRILPMPQQKWIVPVEIHGTIPFTLLAVWACRTETKGERSYIGQVHHALMAHPEWFDRTPVVLAGDFNSNKIWDYKRKIGSHSNVVDDLAVRGLVSAYHEFVDEEQGEESRPTMHLHRHSHRPYHIDYIFIPRDWIPQIRMLHVGTYEQWSKFGDHCPVTIDIELPGAKRHLCK